jgi:hypothetical protein
MSAPEVSDVDDTQYLPATQRIYNLHQSRPLGRNRFT